VEISKLCSDKIHEATDSLFVFKFMEIGRQEVG